MANNLATSKDSISNFLIELMKIDSTTGKEGELARVIKDFLESEGWHVVCQSLSNNPERFNLLITSKADSSPKLVFNTHLDTVPPYLSPKIDKDRINGRGSNDAKGYTETINYHV
jgi:acetylornithine deacetylase